VSARTAERHLAVAGGDPVRRTPVPGWPQFGDDEVDAAREVLGSGRVNYWTGDQGRRFEEEFAAWSGAAYAVALANGTVALELALRALDIGAGHEVIVPAATFIASASAVVAVGAVPVVVDVDQTSLTITPATVAPAITSRTAAVVVVHLAGWPADTAGLVALARRHGLAVVEDCAQAHGARRDGRSVGTIGDIAAWSFCQDKIMTTAGEGGAVTTDDPELWRRIWERRDHGKSWDAVHARHAPGFRWLHHSFGTNARLSEVQSAVGRRQLVKLPGWVERRRHHADALRSGLAPFPALDLPDPPRGTEHAFYRFWARVRAERLAPGWDRDRVLAAVLAEGLPASAGGCTDIHRERAFRACGRAHGDLPVAAELGRTALVLLVHPTLTDDDVADVVSAVGKVLEVATR
jgi:dTDP-4-amino-4,6-dideoxygalactose transaminase